MIRQKLWECDGHVVDYAGDSDRRIRPVDQLGPPPGHHLHQHQQILRFRPQVRNLHFFIAPCLLNCVFEVDSDYKTPYLYN